jgi:hypothetical protein
MQTMSLKQCHKMSGTSTSRVGSCRWFVAQNKGMNDLKGFNPRSKGKKGKAIPVAGHGGP